MEPWTRLDRASAEDARSLLTRCCGSTRWVDRMAARRPFASRDHLLEAAREEWFALAPDDWREAFTHHPKIGDRDALRRRFAATAHLSEQEQRGVSGASEDELTALAEGNRAYEGRFGYIFIVCATGLTAAEMLRMLQERMHHAPDEEIHVAAAEQAKITELRLLGLGS
jgi:2-oxo-4-hydroxy-4-carboxy-5-ureidoimidazoline decarboxylase